MKPLAMSIAAIGLVVAIAVASFVIGEHYAESRHTVDLPNQIIRADSAASNDAFAMATGLVDQDVEGLFTLDFFSGELQCVVLNRRTGKFNGLFKANVTADLGIGQNTSYLMTTGRMYTPGQQGGNSIVYVMDTTSGNFAAYGVPWRIELASRGRAQSGALTLVDVGKARNTPIRGQ